jgi:hypothetical protein
MESSSDDENGMEIPSKLGMFAYMNYDANAPHNKHDEKTHQKYKNIPAFRNMVRNSRTQRIKYERQKFGQALHGRLLVLNLIVRIPDEDLAKTFSGPDLAKGTEFCEQKCRDIFNALFENGTADRRVGKRADDIKAKQKKETKRGSVLDGLIMERCRSHFDAKGGYISDDQLKGFMAEILEVRPDLNAEYFSSSAAHRFFRDQMKICRYTGQALPEIIKPVHEAHIKAEPIAGGQASEQCIIQHAAKPTKIKAQSNSGKTNKKVRHISTVTSMVFRLFFCRFFILKFNLYFFHVWNRIVLCDIFIISF